MKKWILLTVFFVGVGGAFWVSGYFTREQSNLYKEVSFHAGPCNVFCCLPDDIQLADFQKEQIANLEKGYCQCRDTLSLKIDQKRLAMTDVLLQPKPDLSAIDSLLQDIAKLQINLEKQTIRHILEVKNQLPSQQQEQFIKTIVNEIRRRCHHQGLSETRH